MKNREVAQNLIICLISNQSAVVGPEEDTLVKETNQGESIKKSEWLPVVCSPLLID